MSFNAIIGNEKTKEQLSYFIASGRVPHCIVLEGEEGSGKRTLARELALNLLCIGEGEKPCRVCPQCVKVMKNIHPDYIEAAPDKKKGAYPVADIRELVKDAFVSPNEAEYKIYVLANSQYMDAYAQNALLKIIEEPPAYALFILTVDSKSVLLDTVLSRAVVFSMERVNIDEGVACILEKLPEAKEPDVRKALKMYGGNIGKAIRNLDDGATAELSAYCERFCEALLESEYRLMSECASLRYENEKIERVMDFLIAVSRDALVYEDGSECESDNPALARKMAMRLSRQQLLTLIQKAQEIKKLVNSYFNNELLITKIPYELRRAIGK